MTTVSSKRGGATAFVVVFAVVVVVVATAAAVSTVSAFTLTSSPSLLLLLHQEDHRHHRLRTAGVGSSPSRTRRRRLLFSSSSSSGTMATLSPDEDEYEYEYHDGGGDGNDGGGDDDDDDFLPSSTQAHALEVFYQYAASSSGIDLDDPEGGKGGTVSRSSDLCRILNSLDVEADEDEADVLFRYLDGDGDGLVDFEDFLPWYLDAAGAACSVGESFQSLLVGRRTIDAFDRTPVSKDVLERAVQCAIAAPNRSCSEPWRFVDVGPRTVRAFAALNEKLTKKDEDDEDEEDEDGSTALMDWTEVPGWAVVTTKVSPDNHEAEQEDFKSVCCAIQNFMLSMWSEGVGTKWAVGHVQRTQEFAELCGVDTSKERVVGCVWYGYANGGTRYADPRRRKKTVEEVLSNLP